MKKYSIGIDLGGTKILSGVVNIETGEVIAFAKKKTGKDSEPVTDKIIESIEKALSEAQIPMSEIASIGIGAAGQVDRENGVLLYAPNLGCGRVELRKVIEGKLKVPVFVGNDVEVATIGEITHGSGVGYKNLVCIFVGTGVGSGIVNNGRIYSGATGTAGEIGHMVVHSGGRLCGCGEHGCLEAYASRTAIENKIIGALKKGHKSVMSDLMAQDGRIKSSHIKRALELNDELVFEAVTQSAVYLSCGIASVINFYNPELIILGGGLIEAVDFFYEMAVKKAKRKALSVAAEGTVITRTKLKDFSGVVGAALLESYYAKTSV